MEGKAASLSKCCSGFSVKYGVVCLQHIKQTFVCQLESCRYSREIGTVKHFITSLTLSEKMHQLCKLVSQFYKIQTSLQNIIGTDNKFHGRKQNKIKLLLSFCNNILMFHRKISELVEQNNILETMPTRLFFLLQQQRFKNCEVFKK